jgi:hypothetical protein
MEALAILWIGSSRRSTHPESPDASKDLGAEIPMGSHWTGREERGGERPRAPRVNPL